MAQRPADAGQRLGIGRAVLRVLEEVLLLRPTACRTVAS